MFLSFQSQSHCELKDLIRRGAIHRMRQRYSGFFFPSNHVPANNGVRFSPVPTPRSSAMSPLAPALLAMLATFLFDIACELKKRNLMILDRTTNTFVEF